MLDIWKILCFIYHNYCMHIISAQREVTQSPFMHWECNTIQLPIKIYLPTNIIINYACTGSWKAAKKLEVGFSSKQVTFQPTAWLAMTAKASKTCRQMRFNSNTRFVMKHAFLRFSHRKYMGKSLIGCTNSGSCVIVPTSH